jgi:single-strand DNA-binding protein
MSYSDVNRVILLGNVGADPEVRYKPDGDPVATVALATNKSWRDKNTGEQRQVTQWHRVVFFMPQSQVISEHGKKGQRLYVEGELQTRSWEQDGIKRYATEIIARDFRFQPGGGARDGKELDPAAPDGTDARDKPAAAPADFDNFDDDIPF